MIECNKPIYDKIRSGFLREKDFVFWSLRGDDGELIVSKNRIEEIDHKKRRVLLRTIWKRNQENGNLSFVPRTGKGLTGVSFEIFEQPHFNWHKRHELTFYFTLTDDEREMRIKDSGSTGLSLQT